MNKNHAYRTHGTSALALFEQAEEKPRLISYDELAARRESAQRRAGARRQGALAQNSRQRQEISLQTLLEESYSPKRGIGAYLADCASSLKGFIRDNPILGQLGRGTLKGCPLYEEDYSPMILSGSFCAVIGLIAVLAGA